MNTAASIATVLDLPYSWRHEDDLQARLSHELNVAGITHRREVVLGPGERLDLLTDDGVCIEVKIAGSLNAVLRQLQRYARYPQVRELLVVAPRAFGRAPSTIGGKPLGVLLLNRSAL